MSLTFPESYPDGCPSEDAMDASGTVYRIVRSKSLLSDDFRSHYELGTAKTACECRRRGLSVFDSAKSARHRLSLSPQLGSEIAEGSLSPVTGRSLLTDKKSGHITWWVYSGIAPASLFKVLE